jgi:hypothetical protein
LKTPKKGDPYEVVRLFSPARASIWLLTGMPGLSGCAGT